MSTLRPSSPHSPVEAGAGGCGGDDDLPVPRGRLERVCRAAIEAGVAVDDAELCLAALVAGHARRDELQSPASHRVAVYTLGRFALLVHGQPLAFRHRKSPHKPIELLQALIALGGRDVHVGLLMSAVWPTDDSTDPRNLFDNTLHRLRQLLADDDALRLYDGKLTLDATHCWVDAWAFDHLAGLALAQDPASSSRLAEQAIRLYQGGFLAREAPRRWSQTCRDKLHGRFLRLIDYEATRLEKAEYWDAAVACLERALEIDPLAEAIVRRLMAGHARRGRVSEAMRVYARCREHFVQRLGEAPSAATEALRRGIACAR